MPLRVSFVTIFNASIFATFQSVSELLQENGYDTGQPNSSATALSYVRNLGFRNKMADIISPAKSKALIRLAVHECLCACQCILKSEACLDIKCASKISQSGRSQISCHTRTTDMA